MFTRLNSNGSRTQTVSKVPLPPPSSAAVLLAETGSGSSTAVPVLDAPPPIPPAAELKSFSAGSVIGSDLMIMGQGLRIVSKGTLKVDGKIEGDVAGSEVIIGEHGHVTGLVTGENVVVRGEVSGTIKALNVALESSARVEGDVHHNRLSVEQGAHLDGRVRRPDDADELKQSLAVAMGGG